MKILVIENNLELLDMFSDVLCNDGNNVFRAQNEKNAIEIMQKHQIDLIIADVDSNETEGVELIIKVRKLNTPIIAISGMDREKLINEFICSLGIIDILEKPFGINGLNQKITLLKKKKNQK